LRDELHSGGLLLAKPLTYHTSAPAATTTAHFSNSSYLGFHTDGSSKSCNLSQVQFPGEGLPLVDHDILARSISYDMHHGMPQDVHSLPACSGISSPAGNTSNPMAGEVNGAVLNQLLFPSLASPSAASSSSSGHGKLDAACSPSCGSPPHQQLLDRTVVPNGGWQLGNNLASSSQQQQQQLLAHAQQQQIMLDALHNSSQSQTAAASVPQNPGLFGAASTAEQEWFEQLLAAAAAVDSPATPLAGSSSVQWPSAAVDCSSRNAALLNQQQQLLLALQAAALQGGSSSGLLSTPAAQLSNHLLQQVLQLQQQQQQQQQQQAQQLNAALALAALGGQGNSSQANNLLAQQLLLNNPAAAACGLWPQQQANLAAGPGNSLAAMAAGFNPQLACIAPALLHNQQLSAQLLAGQAGTAATAAAAVAPVSTALAQLLSAQLGNLIHQAGPAALAAAAAASGAPWGGYPPGSVEQHPSAPFSPINVGRHSHQQRPRRGSKTSNGYSNSPPPKEDCGGRRTSSSSIISSATKVATTGAASADDTAAIVLLPGMRLHDLSPDGFQDTWGADCPGPDRLSNSHRRSEASVALSIASGCRSSSTASSSSCSSDVALDVAPSSSSPGSSICGGIDWDEGDKPRPPTATAAPPPTDAGEATAPDTTDAAAEAVAGADSSSSSSSNKAGSCPVWFPSPRELSGDDSWYLTCPATNRLFVGNIGCWVDESALLGYFGKYGNVVDVQVRRQDVLQEVVETVVGNCSGHLWWWWWQCGGADRLLQAAHGWSPYLQLCHVGALLVVFQVPSAMKITDGQP
jgi:hypothetical protein